eukprot:2448355-Pyramimonas_sp.AAC.1
MYLLHYLSESDPDKVILSIDGVGAFDHVCRTRMFEDMSADASLQGFLPFVKQWYGVQSRFKWKDDQDQVNDIMQAD